MNFAVKAQPVPFRFLLYTEWVMLASCGSLAVIEALELTLSTCSTPTHPRLNWFTGFDVT